MYAAEKKHNTRLDLTAIVFSEYAFLSLHLLLLLSAKNERFQELVAVIYFCFYLYLCVEVVNFH